MTGKIIRVVEGKGFGFIEGDKGNSYFLHRSEFEGNWQHLEGEILNDIKVPVMFEFTESEKGLRAVNCIRIE